MGWAWVWFVGAICVSAHREPPSIGEVLGMQNNIQIGGDIKDFVQDWQKTFYNSDGTIAKPKMAFSLGRENWTAPIEPMRLPGPFKALSDEFKGQLDEYKSVIGKAFGGSSGGPTPASDLNEKLHDWTKGFNDEIHYLSDRYSSHPMQVAESHAMMDQLGSINDHDAVDPSTENNPLNPYESNKDFSDHLLKPLQDINAKLAPDQIQPLFPNFPAVENAMNQFDESFTAFGDSKKWAKLQEKDKAKGNWFDTLDTLFRPASMDEARVSAHIGGSDVLIPVSNPSKVVFDRPTGRGAFDAKLQKPVSAKSIIQATKQSLWEPNAEIWGLSEKRDKVKAKTLDLSPEIVRQQVENTVNNGIKALKSTGGQYSMFSDPKYRPDFASWDTGGIVGKSMATVIGAREPAADFDDQYNEAMKQLLKPKATGPFISNINRNGEVSIPSFDPTSTKYMDNFKGSLQGTMTDAERILAKTLDTSGIVTQRPSELAAKINPSMFNPQNIMNKAQGSPPMVGTQIKGVLPHNAVEFRDSMAHFGNVLRGNSAVTSMIPQVDKIGSTLQNYATNPANQIPMPEIPLGKQLPSILGPNEVLRKHVDANLNMMKQEVDLGFPLLNEIKNLGFGQAMLNELNDEAQQMSGIPKGALAPTNSMFESLNPFLTEHGYKALTGPAMDPYAVQQFQDQLREAGATLMPNGSPNIDAAKQIGDWMFKNPLTGQNAAKPVYEHLENRFGTDQTQDAPAQ